MNVYILFGGYAFGGTYNLGVYSAHHKAEEAWIAFKAKGGWDFDYHNINKVTLDEEATAE